MSKFSGLMLEIRCDDDDDGMLSVCFGTNKIFYDFYSIYDEEWWWIAIGTSIGWEIIYIKMKQYALVDASFIQHLTFINFLMIWVLFNENSIRIMQVDQRFQLMHFV